MGAGEWIALIGLVLFWAVTLITFWVRIGVPYQLNAAGTIGQISSHLGYDRWDDD